jgi:hypothetical protein
MRSIKTMLLLAFAAVAATALVAPGLATASEWTKEGLPFGVVDDPVFTDGGMPVEATSEPVSLNGKLKFSNGAGGSVDCTISAKATLGANGAGQISEAGISGCKAGGALAYCTVTSATANSLPWPLNATTQSIIVGVAITYKYQGQYCPTPEETISGAFVATPDNTDAISSLTPSGTVNSVSTMGKFSKTASGSLSVSPAARYGVGKVAAIDLSGGTLTFLSGVIGSVECHSLAAQLALKPGSEGTVRSFGATCYGATGWIGSCNVTSTTANGLPWNVLDEGTRIKVSNFSLKLNVESNPSCPNPIYVEGTLYLTPDDTGSISNVDPSGTLKMNGIGVTTVGEPLDWSPAGVFGL